MNYCHLLEQVNEYRRSEGRNEPMSEVEDEVASPPGKQGELNNGNADQEQLERRHSTSTTSDTASACSPKDIQEIDGKLCLIISLKALLAKLAIG